MVTIGTAAPAFELPDHDNSLFSLNQIRGKKAVLYFYPKDDTPGCTREACDFRDQFPQFAQANTVVIGISKDKTTSHQKFKQKYDLPFILLSDTNGAVCEAYGVMVEKTRFGKKYRGINRSTFIVDEQGIIQHMWQNVKVDGHIADVLSHLT